VIAAPSFSANAGRTPGERRRAIGRLQCGHMLMALLAAAGAQGRYVKSWLLDAGCAVMLVGEP
jgi:hypothetical protein